MELYQYRGQHGQYFEGLFGDAHLRKRRADPEPLKENIQNAIDTGFKQFKPGL